MWESYLFFIGKFIKLVNFRSSHHQGENFFPYFFFWLCLYEKMDASWALCVTFAICINVTNMLYALNLFSDVCQLFSIKLKKRKEKWGTAGFVLRPGWDRLVEQRSLDLLNRDSFLLALCLSQPGEPVPRWAGVHCYSQGRGACEKGLFEYSSPTWKQNSRLLLLAKSHPFVPDGWRAGALLSLHLSLPHPVVVLALPMHLAEERASSSALLCNHHVTGFPALWKIPSPRRQHVPGC